MHLNDSQKDTILYYDGDCVFCNSMVALVLANERDQAIRFCALQSDKAEEILTKGGLQSIDLQTIYFLEEGKVYARSDAALHVALHLRWYYRWLRVFRFVPKRWRDFLYDFIAKRRKRLRQGYCVLPEERQRIRFIN
jgi:predicted DCC family thiol-disulfide oxidoreductase YuxK